MFYWLTVACFRRFQKTTGLLIRLHVFSPPLLLAAVCVVLCCHQANGHIAVAKVLRGRLGFVQGQALRARLAREKSGGSVGAGSASSGGSGGGSDCGGAAPSSDRQAEESVAP